MINQYAKITLAVLTGAIILGGCGQATTSDPLQDELELDTHSSAVTKAEDPGANGHHKFCDDPGALCDAGEGDCDSDDQCSPGNYCGSNNGERFGFPAKWDVCVPLTCNDGVKNGDEQDIDCGGAFCVPCAQSGNVDFCATKAGGCSTGEGDCDFDSECQAGLVCKLNGGPNFGLPVIFDVCVPASCNDGVQNNGETGIDCGGTCGDCLHVGYNGGGNFCNSGTLCGVGEGDCDNSAQCEPGLICARDNGPKFNMPASWDVCVPSHCTDEALNGDESDIDCGGSCGACPAPAHCSNMALDAADGETDIDCGGPCDPCAPTGAHTWSSAFGGTAADMYFSTVALENGDVVAAGYFADSITIGGTTLTSAGNSDILITKYDKNGQILWAKQFGGAGLDRAQGIAADAQGNLYLTGYFSGTVSFDGNAVTAAGGADAVVVKLDATGTAQWATRGGGPSTDLGLAVGVDGSNNVTIVGRYKRTVNFGGADLLNVGGTDIFVAQYNTTNGQHIWSQRLGGLGDDAANSIAVDSADNIIISGRFTNSVDFGTGTLVSQGADDVFVLKLNSNGSARWSKRIGSVNEESAFGLAAAMDGTIAVAGRYSGPTDFGQGTVTPNGNYDAFVTVLQPDGAPKWTKAFGTVDSDVGRAVAFDMQGNVIFGGYFSNTIDLGTGPQTASGPSDMFLAKFNPAGTTLWFQGHGGALIEEVRSIAVSSDASITAVGVFYGSSTAGGATFNSAGIHDGFIGHYAP